MIGEQNGPGVTARARLLRLPVCIRRPLQVWGLLWLSGWVLMPLGALLLLPFDPPGILVAGPWQVAFAQHFFLASVVFGFPLFGLLALGERAEYWNTWRKCLPRFFKGIGLVFGMWLFGLCSLIFLAHFALPFLTNAVLRPVFQTWELPITKTKLGKRLSKECPKSLYFQDPTAPDHLLVLCGRPRQPLFAAKTGDVLRMTGRSGPFGITYSGIELLTVGER